MRLYIMLSKNNDIIPFNYQQLLAGVIHKWIGENNLVHGRSGYFTFSWLQNTKANRNGLSLTRDSYFFIGAFDVDFIKMIIKGILNDRTMFCGIGVQEIKIVDIPSFSSPARFLMASPVLLKRKGNNSVRHVTFEDNDFEEALTDNFKKKLRRIGIHDDEVKIRLDENISFRKTKMVIYKGINNKTTFAPIIIYGTPEQIAYAWCVGLGNSTGIGFGALK